MATNHRKALTVVPQTSLPINIMPRDLSSKDLDYWRMARAAAENIYAPVSKPLMDLYDDIFIDGHLTSIIEKRTLACTNINWTFTVNGKEDTSISDFCNKYFFELLITHIIHSKFWKSSLIEVDFRTCVCELVPRQHVVIELAAVLPDPYSTSNGYCYLDEPWNRTTFAVGQPWQLGLMYKVAPYVILKRGDVSDWATFEEMFAMPTRIYFYDPNIPGNYEEVSKAAAQTGANAWAVLPLNSDMKQESQGSKTGNDIYERFADWLNGEMSKTILGQTMTTEAGSSYSQSKTHADTEDDINAADRRFVERILNEKVIPLMIAQGIKVPENGRFHAADIEEELTSKEQLDMDLRIHKEVAPLPLEHFSEKYNVQFDLKAQKEREQKQKQEQQQLQPQNNSSKKVTPDTKKIKLADRIVGVFNDFFA